MYSIARIWADMIPLTEAKPPFVERDPFLLTNDDVIEYLYPKTYASQDELASCLHIFRRGGRIAGRMTVADHHHHSILADGLPEDLGRTQVHSIDRAAVDHDFMRDTAPCVEEKSPQFLLFKPVKWVKHVAEQVIGGISG